MECRTRAGSWLARWSSSTASAGRRAAGAPGDELHGPYVYLSVAGRLVYVPAGLAEVVRDRLEVSARLQAVLEEISAINLELLSRKELD